MRPRGEAGNPRSIVFSQRMTQLNLGVRQGGGQARQGTVPKGELDGRSHTCPNSTRGTGGKGRVTEAPTRGSRFPREQRRALLCWRPVTREDHGELPLLLALSDDSFDQEHTKESGVLKYLKLL